MFGLSAAQAPDHTPHECELMARVVLGPASPPSQMFVQGFSPHGVAPYLFPGSPSAAPGL